MTSTELVYMDRSSIVVVEEDMDEEERAKP